jgi:hypothetical protein
MSGPNMSPTFLARKHRFRDVTVSTVDKGLMNGLFGDFSSESGQKTTVTVTLQQLRVLPGKGQTLRSGNGGK